MDQMITSLAKPLAGIPASPGRCPFRTAHLISSCKYVSIRTRFYE
jgi:hypothetical protein